jgi:hypothetical protein
MPETAYSRYIRALGVEPEPELDTRTTEEIEAQADAAAANARDFVLGCPTRPGTVR